MSSNVNYTTERIGPIHTLYIGSGSSGTLTEEDRKKIRELCGASFISFTSMDACGYFRGKSEDTLVIQIATDDVVRVLNLASEVAVARDQLAVGLASPDANGVVVYRRIIPRKIDDVNT